MKGAYDPVSQAEHQERIGPVTVAIRAATRYDVRVALMDLEARLRRYPDKAAITAQDFGYTATIAISPTSQPNQESKETT